MKTRIYLPLFLVLILAVLAVWTVSAQSLWPPTVSPERAGKWG